jgi:hypothetical protein
MALRSFNCKLREQIRRRDAAMVRMKGEYTMLTQTVGDKVGDVRHQITSKIDQAKNAVTSRLENAQHAVTSRMEHAQSAVTNRIHNLTSSINEKAQNVKDTFNPELQVKKHPWGWVAGAVVAGVVAGPVIKSHFRGGKKTETGNGSASEAQDDVPPPTQTPSTPAQNPIERLKSMFANNPILAPMAAALMPYITEAGHRFMQKTMDRFMPKSGAESPRPEPVSAGASATSEKKDVSARFPKSISRRTAPPPQN